MKRTLALALAVTLSTVTPARAAGDAPPRPRSRESGRHKGLGLAIGAIAGTILGLYAALSLGDDEGSTGSVFAMWTGFAVGGALAGYAAGGGFSSGVDAALEEGRARVREAARRSEAASADPGGALAQLRLSTVRGLADSDGLDAVAGPHVAPEGNGLRIAEAR